MTSVDRRPAQYGYQPDVRTDGTGYRLKDRAASTILTNRVLQPLSLLAKGSRVIDLGSGDGNFVHKAGPTRPYDILAVDLEPSAVHSVRRLLDTHDRKGQDTAVVGDISRLSEIPELGGPADAAVSWRVLHGIPQELHGPTFAQVHEKLKPGGAFYVAVASDQDWKVGALGDRYRPGETNDCSGVMFRDHGVERQHPFPVLFFSPDRLTGLAQDSGFVVGDVVSFDEPSGYGHLKKNPNTYLFAELVKPFNGSDIVTPAGIAADATTIVDFVNGNR